MLDMVVSNIIMYVTDTSKKTFFDQAASSPDTSSSSSSSKPLRFTKFIIVSRFHGILKAATDVIKELMPDSVDLDLEEAFYGDEASQASEASDILTKTVGFLTSHDDDDDGKFCCWL